MKKPIYLDYLATTPVDPRVFKAMKPYFLERYGNAGSTTHEFGDVAAEAVERGREEISQLINAEGPSTIIFTSGATESNNIALQGTVNALKKSGKSHIVTNKIEHKSVLAVVGALEKKGIRVTRLSPQADGAFNLEEVENAIEPETGLISFMHANNEIGTINIVERLGEIAKRHNILFHCDAAQTFGKIAVDVEKMNIHLLSISGHKIYAPKGIGALYIRKSSPEISIDSFIYGGGQEQGIRSGTLAVPLIVGLGEASRLANLEMIEEVNRIDALRTKLLERLKTQCADIVVNGSLINRLPHCLNISFLGVDADALMNNLRSEIAVSNGSACTSLAPMPSYVLQAMGVDNARARSAIRFSIGRPTTEGEINYTIEVVTSAVAKLRNISYISK